MFYINLKHSTWYVLYNLHRCEMVGITHKDEIDKKLITTNKFE